MDLVRDVVPAWTEAEALDAYAATLRALNRVGLTGAHVMVGDPGLLDDVRAARGARRPHRAAADADAPGALDHRRRRSRSGCRWRASAAGCGAPGPRSSSSTACSTRAPRGSSTPAPAAPTRTRSGPTSAATRSSSRRFTDAGLQRDHARGRRRRGARRARRLRGRRAAAARDAPRRAHRDAARRGPAALRGASASRRRCSRCTWRASTTRPRPARGSTACPRAATSAASAPATSPARGALIPLGSDWFVADFDPRVGLAWAQLRRKPGRPDLVPYLPAQALDAETALRGYTTAAARVAGDEDVYGRLRPGLRADVTVLGGDPLAIAAGRAAGRPRAVHGGRRRRRVRRPDAGKSPAAAPMRP